MEENLLGCGSIVRLHARPTGGLGTRLSGWRLELGAFAWVGEADPGGVTLHACDQIPLLPTSWNGRTTWVVQRGEYGVKPANNTLAGGSETIHDLPLRVRQRHDQLPLFSELRSGAE
jgi:hypothetical protein